MDSYFKECKLCKNVVHQFDENLPIICCGKEMELIKINDKESSKEKHIPVVSKKFGRLTVKVGEVTHPSELNHFIDWIYVTCGRETYGRKLFAGEKPQAIFKGNFKGEVKVIAHCNIHGLFEKVVKF